MAAVKGRMLAAGAAATLAVMSASATLIKKYEGERFRAYYDPIGIPTVCYGHTGPDVSVKRVYTRAECERMLDIDMQEADSWVRRCLPVEMTPGQRVALISATFNVGPRIVCGSTLRKKALAGDWVGACKQLDQWKYAGNRVFKGLVVRRADERAICEGDF